jgi:hypothetical protein
MGTLWKKGEQKPYGEVKQSAKYADYRSKECSSYYVNDLGRVTAPKMK